MSDTSLVFNIIGKDKATAVVEGVGRRVRAASLLAAAGQVALGAGFASAAAHALALASAVVPAISLLGSLSAVGLGGIAVIGALGLGFAGMGAALKATGSAGGGAARILGDVAGAERRVAQAQREARDAQEALNDARKSAAERLAGYAHEIRGAELDEEAATNALADAKKRLEEASMARGPGAADQYRDAALAVEQAEYALENAKKRTKELKDEQADANKAGVEGSDEVKAARQREADAVQAVKDAQDALTKAQKGTGGGGGGVNAQADAMARLAPNARAVVRTLLDLLPAWRRVQQAVQNRMWDGVAGDLRALSGTYLSTARVRLVELAGSFNLAVRESAKLATSKKFAQDIDATLGNTNRTAGLLARSVAPVISAFRTWGVVGSQFLPQLGAWVLSLAQRFDRWSTAARESGRMVGWMRQGATVLKQLGTIAGNVVGILAALLRGGGADSGRQLLATITALTTRLRVFLNSAAGQAKIQTVLSNLRAILSGVGQLLPSLAAAFGNFRASMADASGGGGSLRDTLDVTRVVMGFLADNSGKLAAMLPYLAAGFAIVKTAQVAGNLVAVASIPLKAVEVATNWRLTAALRANTTAHAQVAAASRGSAIATTADTAATNGGVLARGRAVVGMVAQKVALVATSAATKAAAAGQWLLNVAMSANPLGLIVIALVAVAAGLYLLWTRSATFRKIVTGAFSAVWGAIKGGWSWVRKNWPLLLSILTGPVGLAIRWIVKNWDSLVGFFRKIPGRIGASLSGIWSGLKSGFRAALNWVIAKWNNFSIGLPGFSFAGVSVPGISINTPNIPYLATGGTARTAGFANVGERGMERVWLPAGASVEPLRGSRAGAGGGVLRIVVDVRGGDGELKRLIRKWIRVDNLIPATR
ncbi:hypothetical protein ACIBSW_06775 [Actinoplanes sp. NPDC049668]|uniref:hypothetical protein n=1 Tax=unclassified Actinoplanes TaxID=2626549 RepID=UPI0033AB34B7